MGRVTERLTRSRVTDPPPVGPWLGVAGMLVGFSSLGLVALAAAAVSDAADGDLWPSPAWLLLGLTQFALLLRVARWITETELRGWPTRVTQRHWRPYIAAGLGLVVPTIGNDDQAVSVVVGLVLTVAVSALPTSGERRVGLALTIYCGAIALALLAEPFSDTIWLSGL